MSTSQGDVPERAADLRQRPMGKVKRCRCWPAAARLRPRSCRMPPANLDRFPPRWPGARILVDQQPMRTHARDLKDGTLWRRARVGSRARLTGDWGRPRCCSNSAAGYENAGQVTRAWAQYSVSKPRFPGRGVGRSRSRLEDQMSTNSQMFRTARPSPTSRATSRPGHPGSARRVRLR